ncbi:VanZ family protein [Parabacteroides sp. 52]|uniref:VanZ family protein n=1 Tax=unclassified Parabacteroides TaxID=2649774 RepID=UPI0013D6FBFE|nr:MULTISPECIES: VanZ family protein [unclassified Parabacteroides]MDH6535237.1 NhaP-type Na+/H+ or K+/H+ antiporter [Parabacteroides sp. PM5-20]NDV55623.1 VanZ family protein [Parabacteroides sp. 52]
MVFYYIKKYPFSLLILLAVIYLSFFKPPSLDVPRFPSLDKLAHFCMYGGLSGVLWIEFLWNHRKEGIRFQRGLVGAAICPILFSGCIELFQEYLTDYRGGEWLDLGANTAGVCFATCIAWYLIRPWIGKRFSSSE